MKNKYLIIGIVVTCSVLIGVTVLLSKDKIVNFFTDEVVSDNKEDSTGLDINKIIELQRVKDELGKEQKSMSYDEVISILGNGTVAFPTPNNKAVKVAYWEFKQNGYEYFLDTIFFNDKFVSMESRLAQFPNSFEEANIDNFNEVKEKVNSATSLGELEAIIGKGVKAMKYYTEENQSIYAWSYEEGFIGAYTIKDDKIIYVKTAKTLEELVVSSANCH